VIRLTDPAVIPLHARIALKGDSFTITDLGQKADLRINNRLVKSIKLVPGDTIGLGNTVMKVSEYTEEAQEEDINPRTEVVVVRERQEQDFSETVGRSQARKRAGVEEEAVGEEPPEDVAEQEGVSGETGPVAAPDRVEGVAPSMSGQPVVDALLRDAKTAKARRTRSRYVSVVVLLLMCLAGLALYMVYFLSSRKAAEKEFNAAVNFAKANPDKEQQIIERYKEVRNKAARFNSDIRRCLDTEIDRLVANAAGRQAALTTLLEQLDKKAAGLIAQKAYEKAIEVYRTADKDFRDLVLEARKTYIAELSEKAAELIRSAGKTKEEEAQKLKAANDRIAMDKLAKALQDVTQALVDGDSDKAIKLLSGFAEDKVYAEVKNQLDSAIITARTVGALDRIQVLSSVGPGAVDSTNAVDSGTQTNMTPVVRAIFAIRKVDLIEARSQLDLAKDHLLYPSLLERAKVSEEDWNLEKEAIQSFGVMWSIIVGKLVSTAPSPDECMAQWKDMAAKKDAEAVTSLSGTVSSFQKKYGRTKFVGKYEKLFDVVKASTNAVVDSAKAVMVVESRGSGIGDGKVIQIDGNTYFVESDKDLPEGAGFNAGVFAEKTVFNMTGTNKAGAARIDVRAVLPIRVLSRKQGTFVFPENTKVDPPVVGDRVLIDKDLQIGTRVVSMIPKAASFKVFSDIFEDKWDPRWVHAAGALKIDRGRLVIDRSSAVVDLVKKDEVKADLQIPLDIGIDPVRVEFDLLRRTESGICVTMGDVDFVVGGTDGKKSGIHVRGTLVRPAVFLRNMSPIPQPVTVIKGRSFAYLAVGKTAVECKLGPQAGASEVKRILFSCEARMVIDNLFVHKLPGSGASEILAVSTDGREVLISKGPEPEWESVNRLQAVYFSGYSDAGEVKNVAMGKIEGFLAGDRMLCSVTEGKVTGVKETVWLVRDLPVAPEEKVELQAKDLAVKYPSVICGVVEEGKEGFFTVRPDMKESVIEGNGFFCLAENFLVHPETEEKLGTWARRGARCEFALVGEFARRIKCTPPAGFPVSGIKSNEVLLSHEGIPDGTRIDLPGKIVPAFNSALTTKHPFWTVMSGEWKEKPDGIVSSPGAKANQVPVVVATESFAGNAQYDLSIRVENEGKPHRDEWAKDVMLQVDFSGGERGVTFGIGAGSATGGVSIVARTMGVKKNKKVPGAPEEVAFGHFGVFGPNAEVKALAPAEPGSLTLVPGRVYDVRVRRVSDTVSCYINGKRVGYVRNPEFRGEVDLIVGAPGRPVTVGLVSARELSPSCRTPAVEPLLGEFGYVLGGGDKNEILVDSSMYGITLNGIVSLVAVDKVVEGEKSKTVFLKRVGLGTVKEIGPTTSIIQRTDAGEPIKRGTKVFKGTQPPSFHFTDSRIGSIDEGL